jgi:hypothetical protein
MWKEITKELFDYYFEVLPPIFGPNNMFAVSEPLDHNEYGQAVYTICDMVDDHYYEIQGTTQQMLKQTLAPNFQVIRYRININATDEQLGLMQRGLGQYRNTPYEEEARQINDLVYEEKIRRHHERNPFEAAITKSAYRNR